MDNQDLIKLAYKGFNTRDIDGVLNLMHPDVQWPNGWEGGYVHGHDEVRAYWTRQWQEIDPEVTPVSLRSTPTGQVEVIVHQLIHDKQGSIVTDGIVKHVYTFDGDKIIRMDIE
ncbi:nuclear transport factor 2 family protein [Spirosoma fluviale]|uniref:SnoaL-like domain-containing protein n=1 Tax=Spirosoma fluviale TaxID=1597977 RepID=A0A286GDB4_9BACT|nr:nuclear transport factor 2 family protein [Spirosoma fluviale]SOD93500.1 SnoaL-like domain-containing protein [Spirosoma fluviale]